MTNTMFKNLLHMISLSHKNRYRSNQNISSVVCINCLFWRLMIAEASSAMVNIQVPTNVVMIKWINK